MQEHLPLYEGWVECGEVGRWYVCNDNIKCVATEKLILVMGWT